ncbi:MAG TPA: ketopantoate reductase family protein [Bryobacteraceae bacterium]|jgi:2-dehydropantoate 2-reductase|nr:ketopantoate reductase family protein [Bryobacteraceae bacterium]
MRILIVGAGAVGGYFGGRLAQAGRDVTFLIRPKRAQQIQAHGLRIVSPYYGDFTVRPKTITAAQIVSPYDIIFLSIKSYDLAAGIDDFAPAVGPRTVIIPVLNGMHPMDVLTERFGENAVLGGVCYVATEIDSQGRVIQLADFQSVSYGEVDGKKTSRIEAVHQVFQGAGFDTAISENILLDMWQKWVFLASVGTITCLLGGNIGEIVAVPGGADLSLSALRECAAIADACGYPLSEAFLAEKSSQLTASASSLTSSMYRDRKEQAPVEVDSILGDLIERGRKQGVSAPIVQAAFVSLTIYQQVRARAKAAH